MNNNKELFKHIKGVAKKSRLLVKLVKSFYFLKQASFKDLINVKKMLLFLKIKPFSMQNYSGIINTYELSIIAEENKIKGCFVETGCWRGGTGGLMAYVADKAGNDRKIHLFDSFEGLPQPTKEDGSIAISLYDQEKTGGGGGRRRSQLDK